MLPNPPLGMNAEIAGPDGLRGGRGSQGRGVVHLHGGHQPDYVDGEPEAWFNPIDAPQVMGAPSVGAEFCASTYKCACPRNGYRGPPARADASATSVLHPQIPTSAPPARCGTTTTSSP